MKKREKAGQTTGAGSRETKEKMNFFLSLPVILILGFVTCGAAAIPLAVIRIRKYPKRRGGGIVVLTLSALYLAFGIFTLTLPETDGTPEKTAEVSSEEEETVSEQHEEKKETAAAGENKRKESGSTGKESTKKENAGEESMEEAVTEHTETRKAAGGEADAVDIEGMLDWLTEYGFDLRFIPNWDEDCIKTMYVYTKSMAEHHVGSMEELQKYSKEYLEEPVYNNNFNAVYRYVSYYRATTDVDEDIEKLGKELFGDEAEAIFERAHEKFYPKDAVNVTYIHALERGETVSNTGGKTNGEIYLEAYYAANYMMPGDFYELDTDNYLEYCRNLDHVSAPVMIMGDLVSLDNDYAYLIVHVKDSIYGVDDWYARIDTSIILDDMPVVMSGDQVGIYGVYIGLDSKNNPVIAAVGVDVY